MTRLKTGDPVKHLFLDMPYILLQTTYQYALYMVRKCSLSKPFWSRCRIKRPIFRNHLTNRKCRIFYGRL